MVCSKKSTLAPKHAHRPVLPRPRLMEPVRDRLKLLTARDHLDQLAFCVDRDQVHYGPGGEGELDSGVGQCMFRSVLA